MRPLLIRADASPSIGTGHVMRCLALAQAWREIGGRATFAMAGESPLQAKLEAEGFGVETIDARTSTTDAKETRGLTKKLDAEWIVLDGYGFNESYEVDIQSVGAKVLVLDDFGHNLHYFPQIILNQNLHATESLYPKRSPAARLLLGTKFVLLRKEFRDAAPSTRHAPFLARKVFVTLGGSDPENVTSLVLRALSQVKIEDLQVVAVVGAVNPRLPELQAEFGSLPGFHILPHTDEMPKWMRWAEVAIGAGGTTSWERAYFQLPTLALVLADNQRDVVQRLKAIGAVRELDPTNPSADAIEEFLRDAPARETMGRIAGELVDGFGVDRVVARLRSCPLWLRSAQESDCRLLWEWANDPTTRAVGFHSEPIPYEDHCRWFAARWNQPGCRILLGIDESEQSVGVVRIEKQKNDESVVSISLAAEHRGRGLAKVLLAEAIARVRREGWGDDLHAYIKPENEASLALFSRVGFERIGEEMIRGTPATHWILKPPEAT